MIQWVAEISAEVVSKDNVYIATDDKRIFEVVTDIGYQAIMTSDKCMTGTDRLAEASRSIDADIYINVQGDEPLVNTIDIRNIIESKKRHPDFVINGYCKVGEDEDPESTNIPKVIFTEQGRMIYMSRKSIPGFKEKKNAPDEYHKQVCIYAFNRKELLDFQAYGKKSTLEKSEDIEILRFLEWEQPVHMVETSPGSLAVDVPEDVENVEKTLIQQSRTL